jgi:hypothetical protein
MTLNVVSQSAYFLVNCAVNRAGRAGYRRRLLPGCTTAESRVLRLKRGDVLKAKMRGRAQAAANDSSGVPVSSPTPF